MSKDLVHSVDVKVALNAAAITATTATTAMDVQGYESLTFIVSVGTFATFDGTNNLTVNVQRGNQSDGSDAANIAASGYIESYENGTSGWDRVMDAATQDETVYAIGVHIDPAYRYYRCNIVEAGTVSAVVGVSALLGHARRMPV